MTHTAETFRTWFNENLKEYATDIASHGADCGFPHISYTSDTVELFDKYGDEIWEMAYQDAADQGLSIAEFVGSFQRKDMLDTLNTFKNLMVWYACEVLAQELEMEAEEA